MLPYPGGNPLDSTSIAKRQGLAAGVGLAVAILVVLANRGTAAEPPRSARLVHQRTLSHTHAVYWAAFSQDGKKLATASLDNTVKLWNVADGKRLAILKGHGDGVAFVGFMPDGKIATASLDKQLKIWSADGSGPIRTLSGHLDYLTCAAVARSGPLLASGAFDKTVRLWDGKSGTALATLTGHTANVQTVAISAKGHIVASGGDDRTIRLWDVRTKKLLRTLTGHKLTVEALAFSPKDDLLASASADGTARLWNPGGKLLATIAAGPAGVKSLAFSADGRLLALGQTDGTIRLVRIKDRRELVRTKEHKNSVYGVAFNPTGTVVASAGFDGKAHLWEIRFGGN